MHIRHILTYSARVSVMYIPSALGITLKNFHPDFFRVLFISVFCVRPQMFLNLLCQIVIQPIIIIIRDFTSWIRSNLEFPTTASVRTRCLTTKCHRFQFWGIRSLAHLVLMYASFLS